MANMVSGFPFYKKSIEHVHDQIAKITKVINMFRWITDGYVSDFFVLNYWDDLPKSWQDFLRNLSPPELAGLLTSTHTQYRSVQPLSMMALQICIFSFSLSRNPVHLENSSVCKSLFDVFTWNSTKSEQKELKDNKKETKKQSVLVETDNKRLLTIFSPVSCLSQSSSSCSCEQSISEKSEVKNLDEKDSADFQVDKKESEHFNRLFHASISPAKKEEKSSEKEETSNEHETKTSCILNQRENTPRSENQTVVAEKLFSGSTNKDLNYPVINLKGNTCNNIENVEKPKIIRDSKVNNWNCNKSFDSAALKNGQCVLLKHFFRKHIKPKKQHEIERMSKMLSMLCSHCNSSHVVDVGAGLGHLSRLLTFAYGVKVTTIESTECHAPKASKFDDEIQFDIKKALVKKLKEKKEDLESLKSEIFHPHNLLPSHIVSTITPAIKTKDFLKLISKHDREQNILSAKCETTIVTNSECSVRKNEQLVGKERSSIEHDDKSTVIEGLTEVVKFSNNGYGKGVEDRANKDEQEYADKFVLASLHACGDLTPMLLKLFVNCESALGLASVGCCYMKMSTQSSSDIEKPGYPMSNFVRSLHGHELSFPARELACHFIDSYIERLKDNSEHLKVHGYRAAVQYIIFGLKPDLSHGPTKCSIKNAAQMKFEK